MLMLASALTNSPNATLLGAELAAVCCAPRVTAMLCAVMRTSGGATIATGGVEMFSATVYTEFGKVRVRAGSFRFTPRPAADCILGLRRQLYRIHC